MFTDETRNHYLTPDGRSQTSLFKLIVGILPKWKFDVIEMSCQINDIIAVIPSEVYKNYKLSYDINKFIKN